MASAKNHPEEYPPEHLLRNLINQSGDRRTQPLKKKRQPA